jgi:hypothetical protein
MGRIKSEAWLACLTSQIPPPQTPVDAGPPGKRDTVQQALGLALPDDLFEFARVYGSGEFRMNEYSLVLSIESPFSSFFVRAAKKAKKQLKGLWEGYDLYPDSPGLFPCGTGNGPWDVYFYTDGSPNHWPLVTNVSVSRLVEIDMSLPEDIFRLLNGSLEGEAGEIDNPWFREQKGRFWFQPLASP